MISGEKSTLFPESPRFTLTTLVLCTLVTAAIWIFSLTILFPVLIALRFSSGLRSTFFSLVYSKIVTNLNGFRSARPYRRKLFEPVNELANKPGRRSKPIKILEIGVGPGVNFEFYPENHSLTMLDMNPYFEKYIQSTLEKYPQIKVENMIHGFVEDMSAIEDNTFDVVVATYLLCSSRNPEAALKEIHRVLKKGGKYICLEHVVYPKNYFFGYMVQHLTTPIWKIYTDGCHLNRNILLTLHSSPFSEVSCKTYYPDSMFAFLRPTVMAICTK